jgi:hypothetical protein
VFVTGGGMPISEFSDYYLNEILDSIHNGELVKQWYIGRSVIVMVVERNFL